MSKYCDFYSVGSNDLTQYALGVDRDNKIVNKYYNDHSKAIFKLLKILAKKALKQNKWVGICGELGSNPNAIKKLLKYGFTEFSMNPARILEIRNYINNL